MDVCRHSFTNSEDDFISKLSDVIVEPQSHLVLIFKTHTHLTFHHFLIMHATASSPSPYMGEFRIDQSYQTIDFNLEAMKQGRPPINDEEQQR